VEQLNIIGLDLAKNVFQAHGMRADGSVAFRKKIARVKLQSFFASVPKCLVAMEACASAHHWARQINAFGHEVRLIAPIYVKPFVKRNKNDAADAEAIAEAASRPTMRFVAVKSVEKQASGMAFKTRDLLVRQRTQTINALRGHMAEYGVVAPNGPVHVARLVEALEVPDSGLPAPVIALCQMLFAHIASLSGQIGLLEKELRERARRDKTATRLMTIPGVGVICATAMEALAPPLENFAKGRDFAAELVWRQVAPGWNLEDGSARFAPVTHQRRDDGRSMGFAQRRAGGILARTHVEEKAPPCRRGGAGEPHSEDRLGSDDERWGLPSFGRGSRMMRRSRLGSSRM
jgi:transposase